MPQPLNPLPDLPPVFRPDRWGLQLSSDGASLHFGDGVLGTSVELDPAVLRRTARELEEIVAAHEARFGTLWSEDGQRFGAITDARLQWQERPFASPWAHRLHGLVRNLPLQGVERSFKLLAGRLWRDRFLVGLSASRLAPEDVDVLAARMDAPAEFRTALRTHLAQATFLHVGFEDAADHSTYKFYLEFAPAGPGPGAAQTAMPLYLGYKWNPLDPSQRTVSVYRRPSSLGLEAVRSQMAAAYGNDRHAIFRMAEALVDEAARRAGVDALTFVDVTDDDAHAQRLSFDVNLYESGMTLRDLAPRLQALAVQLGIPDGDVATLMNEAGDDLAGHVSGGTDRHGRAFLTLYHACPRGESMPP